MLSPVQGREAAQETHLPAGCCGRWPSPDGRPGLGRARSLPVSPSPTPSGGAATRKESETAGRLSRTRGRGGGPAERVEALMPFLPLPFHPSSSPLLAGSPSVPQSPRMGGRKLGRGGERCCGLKMTPCSLPITPPPPHNGLALPWVGRRIPVGAQ